MLWAFRKLSKKDRIVLVVAGVIFFAALVSCLFLVMSGVFFTNISFPQSTLSKESALQNYKLGKYDDLPIEIAFPGTAYSVDIKGTELSGTDEGALFDAGDNLYIFAGTVGRGEPTSLFMGGCLPSLFNELYLHGEYIEKLSDEGYLNATLASYECGIVSIGDDKYYCMTYRYSPLSGNRDILFGTARSEKNASTLALKWDKSGVLDKMFMTIKKDPNGEITMPVLEPLKEAAPPGRTDGPVNSPVGDTTYKGNEILYASPEQDESMDTSDDSGWEDSDGETDYDSVTAKLEETLNEQKEDDFNLAYPGQEMFRLEAEVPEELEGRDVAVRLVFTKVLTEIYFATITCEETGRVESAEYLNEDNDGNVIFVIKNCESGTWTMEVERQRSLGSYYLDVREESLLQGVMAPNEDHPRPLD